MYHWSEKERKKTVKEWEGQEVVEEDEGSLFLRQITGYTG